MERHIQYTLTLLSIHCYVSDEGDADEVYLKKDGKKIWPAREKYKSMKDKSYPVNLEYKVNKGSKLSIEIWDYDFWSKNDLLGVVEIDADSAGGPYNADMKSSGKGNAKYGLEYEIL